MTFLLYKAFSHFLLPPGLFILLSLAAGIIAFRLLRTSAPGKSSLKTRFRYILIFSLANAFLIYFLSIEPAVDLFAAPLERGFRPINQIELEKGDCFVILGGGINEGAPRSLAKD